MSHKTSFEAIPQNPDLILINSPLRDYGLHPRLNNFTLPTLGLGYIATCAELAGFSVYLLDAEHLGLSVDQTAETVNTLNPRWVGLNLLAPTYRQSVSILRRLNPDISVMLGGHHAKAIPKRILNDFAIPRIDAMIIGEAETRVTRLLENAKDRTILPKVFWRNEQEPVMPNVPAHDDMLLAPDIDQLPFVNRKFHPQDPYFDGDALESAMVASRGCPFDCSFCGAAVSANRDVTIRMRNPLNIIEEVSGLRERYGVSRVRFVDDLFLANRKVMNITLTAFVKERLGMRWDATGRVNVLASAPDALIELMAASGCREVALGIETGSDRLLQHIDKKITVNQIEAAVLRLCQVGINVKGYFILGLPTETRREHMQTLDLIKRLWGATSGLSGRFRCSAFEYRPYPGTPDWKRLLAAGFPEDRMLEYDPDVRGDVFDPQHSLDRDEFNFSTGLQFGEVPVEEVRRNLASIMRAQHLQ